MPKSSKSSRSSRSSSKRRSMAVAPPLASSKPTYATSIMMAKIVTFVFISFFLVLNSWFLMYVDRLASKECKCAHSWHRSVLQGVFVALILTGISTLLFSHMLPFMHIIQGILVIINLVYIVTAFLFVQRIKKENCACAQTTAFKVINFINIVYIILLALAIVARVVMTTSHRISASA
jgi:hypothetical protein